MILAVIRLHFSLPTFFFLSSFKSYTLHTQRNTQAMPFTAHCNKIARVEFFFVVLVYFHCSLYCFSSLADIFFCYPFNSNVCAIPTLYLFNSSAFLFAFGLPATLLINLILHVKIYQSQSHSSICISLYTCVITSQFEQTTDFAFLCAPIH